MKKDKRRKQEKEIRQGSNGEEEWKKQNMIRKYENERKNEQ